LQEVETERKSFLLPCRKCTYEDCRCPANDEARFQDMLHRDAEHRANEEESEVRERRCALARLCLGIAKGTGG
jgi:hypothetical protein